MPNYKEATFSSTYRAAQVRQILHAVQHRRSIGVFGLAGMGKSNLFRFIVAQPHVRAQYLTDAAQFLFVFIDCNLVDPRREDALLERLDVELERAGLKVPANPARSLYLRYAIESRIEHADAERVIVLMFDPLDQMFRHFESHFWAYLRGLRDLQGNVVFVLGARRPPTPLGELQELFVDACWVPPLAHQDALDSLARDEQRLGIQFSERAKELLVSLTGGHAGLLKNVADLYNQVHMRANASTLLQELSAPEAIQHVCGDLWSELGADERRTLQSLGANAAVDVNTQTFAFLAQAGLVRLVRATPQIFSPLWKTFVMAQTTPVVQIQVNAAGAVQFESWRETRVLHLNPNAAQLLCAMAQAPERIYTHAQLARLLYSGDPANSREAVSAQIKRLRKMLNTVLSGLTQDATFNAILPQRKQGYRLNLTTRTAWHIEYHVTS